MIETNTERPVCPGDRDYYYEKFDVNKPKI